MIVDILDLNEEEMSHPASAAVAMEKLSIVYVQLRAKGMTDPFQ